MDLRELAVASGQATRHPWEQARLEVVWRLIGPVLEEKGDRLTILDIGSGDAFVIGSLAERLPRARCVAVDINYTEDDLFRLSYSDCPSNVMFFRDLEEALDGVGQVDLVTLLDVVEHIENDREFLQDLAHRAPLKRETGFLVTVPAFQGLFSSHDVFMGHYRRYAGQQLSSLLVNAGLTVTDKGYFFFSLLLPRGLKALLENLNKTGGEEPENSDLTRWKVSSAWASFLKRILLLDFAVGRFLRRLGISLPGLSHYCLCRQSPKHR